METLRLKYEKIEYENLNEMAITLLHEANEQLVRIDLGQLDNETENRNVAKFRLLHLQRSFGSNVPEEYRAIYNSLWSQLYRLEHQGKYTNPYLLWILDYVGENGKI